MTKKQRLEVYNKFDGHCAYCGKEIEYKDMQVDHLIPQRRATNKAGRGKLPIEQIENFDNYMPSCRRCNHYKRAHNLETFRRYIEEIPEKLLENYICKVGVDYNLVEFHYRKIKFYFEIASEQRVEYNLPPDDPDFEISDLTETGIAFEDSDEYKRKVAFKEFTDTIKSGKLPILSKNNDFGIDYRS